MDIRRTITPLKERTEQSCRVIRVKSASSTTECVVGCGYETQKTLPCDSPQRLTRRASVTLSSEKQVGLNVTAKPLYRLSNGKV